MCTLLFRHEPGDMYPLALLSNRDERDGRPADGWAWRETAPRSFAPSDLEAGGTWMGLSASGVVAALTNIFPQREEPDLHSRGALVQAMLALPMAADASEGLREELAARPTNNFNLLVADGSTAMLFAWDQGELREQGLEPGVYEVANSPFDGARLPGGPGPNEAWLEERAGRLVEHPTVCKHEDGYGTRSSAQLLLRGDDPAHSLVWSLEGHPCEGVYEQVLGPGQGHLGE